jgi:pyruvate dehydrogenase E2 component (dihydrolipoamide acetyltransferase)
MPQAFLLPDIGEGTAEGEIVRWHVKPGDLIHEDQPLVEVMTDKVTVEIPSPLHGRVLELCGDVGDVMKVGSPLVMIDPDATDNAELPTAAPAQPTGSVQTTNEPPPTLRPEKPPEAAPANPPAQVDLSPPPIAPESPKPPAQEPTPPAAQAPNANTQPLAAPATRRLARERNVDLAQVQGSGPGGRITPEDVTQFSAQPPAPDTATQPKAPAPAAAETPAPSVPPESQKPQDAPPAPDTATEPKAPAPAAAKTPAPSAPPESPKPQEASPADQRIPFTGIRRKIAQHLVHAKQTAPHFGYVDEVDMTEVVRLRTQLKPLAQDQGTKLAYLPFIMLAVLSGLKAFPSLNASLDDAAQEIVLHRAYNLGVAVDTEQGLLVPVVPNANTQSLFGLAQAVQTLADKARNGKLAPADVQGGTFTLTSIGSIGGLFGLPIINHPEVAILGINKIIDRPVVQDGQVVVRPMMYLSLSCDHRVVDGAMAARFLNHVIDQLQNPLRLVMDPNQVVAS